MSKHEPGAEWVFFRNILGHWCWEKRIEHKTTLESRRSFESREDCIADAMRNGFDAPTRHSQPLPS